MQPTTYVLIAVALGSAIWATVTMVRVYEFLRRRGEKASFLFLRIMIFRYLRRYKAITLEERGRVGPLYHQFTTSVNVALLAAAAAAVAFISSR